MTASYSDYVHKQERPYLQIRSHCEVLGACTCVHTTEPSTEGKGKGVVWDERVGPVTQVEGPWPAHEPRPLPQAGRGPGHLLLPSDPQERAL